MKKIALILVLVLSFGALFSCGEEDVKSAAETIAEAQEKMESTRTKMTVEYTFTSNNSEVVEILNASMPVVETIVDGENSWAHIKTPNPLDPDEFIEAETWIIGNKVYANANGTKYVTTYSEDKIKEKINETLDSRVDLSDLYNLGEAPEISTDGDKIIISFDSFKEGKKLTDFAPQLEELVASTALANVKGEIVINDGIYEKAELSFDITLDEITVTTSMIMKIESDVAAITAPADADTYQEVPDIFGIG